MQIEGKQTKKDERIQQKVEIRNIFPPKIIKKINKKDKLKKVIRSESCA